MQTEIFGEVGSGSGFNPLALADKVEYNVMIRDQKRRYSTKIAATSAAEAARAIGQMIGGTFVSIGVRLRWNPEGNPIPPKQEEFVWNGVQLRPASKSGPSS